MTHQPRRRVFLDSERFRPSPKKPGEWKQTLSGEFVRVEARG